MKLPEINLEKIEEERKRNFKQRLKFIDFYTDWLKKTPNEEWSKQQKKILKVKD